jgi:RNA polymerase sigma-70 factor (ECF subfamily)
MFAQLSEYLDGRLKDLPYEHIQRHLRDCPPCVTFVADLKRAIERCRSYNQPCESATAGKLRQLLVAEYLRLSRPGAATAR